MTNKVEVVIGGKVLSIRSEESAEHVQKIAMYVSQKIDMLKAKNLSAVVDERLKTLLIALNIADDHFKTKDQLTAQEVINKNLTAKAAKLEKENAALKSQTQKLQTKLDKVSGEFEEFLRNFDSAGAAAPKDTKPGENPSENNEHIVHLGDTRKAAN
ncbi:MAG: cell division protein ZapA [Defluviitaleaceae bacterium]|nr:cell division protein ZapA [Defluviitaleaceae bacterium]